MNGLPPEIDEAITGLARRRLSGRQKGKSAPEVRDDDLAFERVAIMRELQLPSALRAAEVDLIEELRGTDSGRKVNSFVAIGARLGMSTDAAWSRYGGTAPAIGRGAQDAGESTDRPPAPGMSVAEAARATGKQRANIYAAIKAHPDANWHAVVRNPNTHSKRATLVRVMDVDGLLGDYEGSWS
jgi:hypothetical protein